MTNKHSDFCRMLGVFEPGILPSDVCYAVARLVVLPTFVIIPFVRQDGRTMVSLQVRDSADPHYASMLHPPGTVIRPNDASMSAVYNRLIATELPGAAVKHGPIFVYIALDAIAGGREISLVHWIELAESGARPDLFDTAALPNSIVPTDYPRIAEAAAHFEAFHGKGSARR